MPSTAEVVFDDTAELLLDRFERLLSLQGHEGTRKVNGRVNFVEADLTNDAHGTSKSNMSKCPKNGKGII